MRKQCAVCGSVFEAKRPSGKYCGARCRQRAHRKPDAAAKVVPLQAAPASAAGSLEAATMSELEAAGRVDSAAGQAALALARRVDAGQGETGASVAAVVREYRATLADAVRDAEAEADPLDEVRARRDRKLASG